MEGGRSDDEKKVAKEKIWSRNFPLEKFGIFNLVNFLLGFCVFGNWQF